jgi:branched-chain amino acid transport system ATP-binding protein
MTELAREALAGRGLVCENLSVNFGRFLALSNVTIRLDLGRVYAVIGPNGAGKTTFANVLSGLVTPSTGRVLLDGRDITQLPTHRRAAAGIGRSFQIINIFREMSVFENLRLAAQARRFRVQPFWWPVVRTPALARSAEAILDRVGLRPLAHRIAGTLSHGDQRALELGMALINEPSILILDEPLAGVGQHGIDRAVALVADAARERTVIMIEHNMEAVMRLSDQIIVLAQGRVLAEGSPQSIRANADVRAAYLGAMDGTDAGA